MARYSAGEINYTNIDILVLFANNKNKIVPMWFYENFMKSFVKVNLPNVLKLCNLHVLIRS